MREYLCIDCSYDTFQDEYYMVHDVLWIAAGMRKKNGMLCIGCLETRIGRQLTKRDFTDAPINSAWLFPQSDRLRDRLDQV